MGDPFGTRLWGEPVVLYRDENGEATCVKDLCPHRSAPLSMGEVEDGKLRCFYHGWAFGEDGNCVDIPTVGMGAAKKPTDLRNFCATGRAVVERDGLLWVWRGETLAADAQLVPEAATTPALGDDADDVVTITTTLDYAVGWQPVMDFHLGLAKLGSLPGGGEQQEQQQQPAASFHAPNIVRQTGADGYSEERHVVPISHDRTRVFLRQQFKREGAVAALLNLPNGDAILSFLIRNQNYELAIDSYAELQTAAAKQPLAVGGSAESLHAQFRSWLNTATASQAEPYFRKWSATNAPNAAPTALSPSIPGVGAQQDDSKIGTFGLKRDYVQATPALEFAPLQESDYRKVVNSLEVLQQSVTAAVIAAPAAMLASKVVGPIAIAANALPLPPN